jgi:hypothetical protein
MKQEFSVHTDHDHAAQVVEVVIRCSPGLVRMAIDVAIVQVEEVTPIHGTPRLQEGPQAEPPRPAPPAPSRVQDEWIDAQWAERNLGPVLPNLRF